MQIDVNLSANINDILENKTTLASGWVELDGVIRFPVHVRQYTDSKDGKQKNFVSYPQRKTKDGYTGIAYPSSAAVRSEIDSRVLDEYHNLIINKKWEEVPVEEARVTRFEPRGLSKVRLVGMATVKVSGVTINGIQVKEGQYGMIVQMPQYCDKNGEYRDMVYATNRVMQEAISKAVITAYNSPEGIFKYEPDLIEQWIEKVENGSEPIMDMQEETNPEEIVPEEVVPEEIIPERTVMEQQAQPDTADKAVGKSKDDKNAAGKENDILDRIADSDGDYPILMTDLAECLQYQNRAGIQQVLMRLPLTENISRRQYSAEDAREIRFWEFSHGTQTAGVLFADEHQPSSPVADSPATCAQQVVVTYVNSADRKVLSETILYFESGEPDEIESNRAAAQGFVTLATGEKFASIAPDANVATQKREPVVETPRLRQPTTLRQPRL